MSPVCFFFKKYFPPLFLSSHHLHKDDLLPFFHVLLFSIITEDLLGEEAISILGFAVEFNDRFSFTVWKLEAKCSSSAFCSDSSLSQFCCSIREEISCTPWCCRQGDRTTTSGHRGVRIPSSRENFCPGYSQEQV